MAAGDHIEIPFRASHRDAMAQAIVDDHDDNSPNCIATRGNGELVSKVVPITAATTTIDLFQITGAVRIYGISGVFTDVTDVADIDNVYLELDDGGVQTDLTADGVTCDGVTLGALLLKVAAAGTVLTLMDADQIRLDETDPKKVLFPFNVNGMNGATNVIRMSYTSVAGPDCAIAWAVEWRHLVRHEDGNVVAV